MKLVACGFNAHSQTSLNAGETDDIYSPQVVLKASSIRILYVGWSDTVFEADGEVQWCGPSGHLQRVHCDGIEVREVFGDHTGPKGALGEDHDLFFWTVGESGRISLDRHPGPYGHIDHIAIAGNGWVCAVGNGNHMCAYQNMNSFKGGDLESRYILSTDRIKQLVANETSFACLSADGTVYTWGDPRYPLGREISSDQPASKPHVLSALEGLPVAKVAAGAWIGAALSEAGDIYLWGSTMVGGVSGKIEHMPTSADEVGLLDLGDEVNIIDVAVGNGHVWVLTDEGEVYGAGRNENGQLGLDTEGGFQEQWVIVEGEWSKRAKGVFSGPSAWNTFAVAT